MDKSIGHVEFIGKSEFYLLPDGWLIRAPISEKVANDGCRPGMFCAFGSAAEFAVRLARMEERGGKE